MTRAQLQLLVAVIAGLLALAAPLVLLVRAMRREERLVVLGSVTGLLLLIAAWGLEPRRRWREWRSPAS